MQTSRESRGAAIRSSSRWCLSPLTNPWDPETVLQPIIGTADWVSKAQSRRIIQPDQGKMAQELVSAQLGQQPNASGPA